MLHLIAQTLPTTLPASSSDLQLVVQLYDSAVTRIEWFVGICLALIGIAVPIGVTIFSKIRINAIKQNSDKAIADLKVEFATQLLALKSENTDAIAKLIEETKKQLATDMAAEIARVEEQLAIAEGGVYHVQGNEMKKSLPGYAWTSFAIAASKYIRGKSWGNLGKVLDLAITDLNGSHKDAINALDRNEDIDSLITKIEKLDDNGAFSESCRRLKRAWEAAKARPRPAPVQDNPE